MRNRKKADIAETAENTAQAKKCSGKKKRKIIRRLIVLVVVLGI